MRRAVLFTLSLSVVLISAPVAQHRLQPIATERG
jgi:hypothetical protein